jgi:hypothetical protein
MKQSLRLQQSQPLIARQSPFSISFPARCGEIPQVGMRAALGKRRVARPTGHCSLLSIGRIMRTDDNKLDCLIAGFSAIGAGYIDIITFFRQIPQYR